MKKKHTWYIIGMMGVAFFWYGIREATMFHPQYSLMEKQPIYPVFKHNDDTLRILCIGDSWIYWGKKYESNLSGMLIKRIGRPIKISSVGLPGKTSKEVYSNIFHNPIMYKQIKGGADYCFVSVGINDLIQNKGSQYYTYHTCLILDFLINNNIHPILLEIPNIDIKGVDERQKDKQWKKFFSLLVYSSPTNRLKEYRDNMTSRLKEMDLNNSVFVLQCDLWNNKVEKDLKDIYQSDGVHLNSVGYSRLDSTLVNLICDDINALASQ